jgi:hypothetical protein
MITRRSVLTARPVDPADETAQPRYCLLTLEEYGDLLAAALVLDFPEHKDQGGRSAVLESMTVSIDGPLRGSRAGAVSRGTPSPRELRALSVFHRLADEGTAGVSPEAIYRAVGYRYTRRAHGLPLD